MSKRLKWIVFKAVILCLLSVCCFAYGNKFSIKSNNNKQIAQIQIKAKEEIEDLNMKQNILKNTLKECSKLQIAEGSLDMSYRFSNDIPEITDGDKYTILTDIQGLEDHMGDMDFKVAGTRKGICAMQMDIKIKGVNRQILSEALLQAKKARMEILDVMESAISEPRHELSPYAPKIETFRIDPEKIKDVIGRGGEMITKIILESSNVKTVNDKNAVKVDLEDDGRVIIYHTDSEIIRKTRERIEQVVKEVEIGKVYTCKVVKVEDFGAFVELWPGCEGLIHISQLDVNRVEKVSDVVNVGDEIVAIATGYDRKGKLNLSRKDLLLKNKKSEEK